jgi:hypothetical protein
LGRASQHHKAWPPQGENFKELLTVHSQLNFRLSAPQPLSFPSLWILASECQPGLISSLWII